MPFVVVRNMGPKAQVFRHGVRRSRVLYLQVPGKTRQFYRIRPSEARRLPLAAYELNKDTLEPLVKGRFVRVSFQNASSPEVLEALPAEVVTPEETVEEPEAVKAIPLTDPTGDQLDSTPLSGAGVEAEFETSIPGGDDAAPQPPKKRMGRPPKVKPQDA